MRIPGSLLPMRVPTAEPVYLAIRTNEKHRVRTFVLHFRDFDPNPPTLRTQLPPLCVDTSNGISSSGSQMPPFLTHTPLSHAWTITQNYSFTTHIRLPLTTPHPRTLPPNPQHLSLQQITILSTKPYHPHDKCCSISKYITCKAQSRQTLHQRLFQLRVRAKV